MPAAGNVAFDSVDAVELLAADHERIRQLFTHFERLHGLGEWAQAHAVARRVCRELAIHSTLEEEIFYPEMRAMLDDAEAAKSARVEHALIAHMGAQIAADSIHDPKFAARVRVLARCVERHMREEEDRMFARARAAGFDIYEIGARLEARRHDLQKQLTDSAPFPGRKSCSVTRAQFTGRRAIR